jgi:hypothetical protein
MADRRPLTLSIDSQLSNISNDEYLTEMNSERRELFTSYRSPPIQLSVVTGTTTATTGSSLSAASSSFDDTDSLSSTIREEYQIRTLGAHNIDRLSILPIYPPVYQSPTTATVATTTPAMMTSARKPNLLLANVPSKNIQKNHHSLRIFYQFVFHS